jgi:MoxR-like ATPase
MEIRLPQKRGECKVDLGPQRSRGQALKLEKERKMVNVESWDGNGKSAFVAEIENAISPLLGEIVLSVPHNGTRAPEEDGKFHILIWSSPMGKNNIKPPERIWGIGVDCSDGAFPFSGQGIAIKDGDYCVAELIGKNLFVHHDVCHHGTDREVEIFRIILLEVVNFLPSVLDGKPTEGSVAYQIRRILSENFVFTDEVSRILSLGFAGQKNCIIYGPAGHAKSEMIKAVVDGLEIADETFYQFFGEGMDESRLFGGLNFRKLEEEKILEYYPEKSFLNYRMAVFEELFDAPASVLLALKDVLTAHELRNGSQRFKMKTELIVCLTNKEPAEISELGAAAHALVERFPLQLNLKWKDYSARSYLRMFEKVAGRVGGPVLNGFKGILAEIVAKATVEGQFISPRTAMHAYQVCQAAAVIRGGDQVERQDLRDLRFVDGLESLGETIEADLKSAMERAEAERAITALVEEYQKLNQELEAAETPIKALQAGKKFGQLENKLANVKVTDALTEKRNNLRESVARKINEANAKALDLTRI